MANEINSPELCLKAVDVLQNELKSARKSLINSESCIVNRSIMTAQLEYLKENMPETVEMAAKIVAEEENIRPETEQKRKEILDSAQMQANQMINDSNHQSQQIIEKARMESSAMLEKAGHEATAYIESAKAEVQKMINELVSAENIVRRAHVESEEMRENARQDAVNLHKNTLDYIDSLLAETDRKMSELINNIRLERNEIRNRR